MEQNKKAEQDALTARVRGDQASLTGRYGALTTSDNASILARYGAQLSLAGGASGISPLLKPV